MSIRDEDKARLFNEIIQTCADIRQTEGIDYFITSVPIDKADLIRWLAASNAKERWYWRSRDRRIEIAGTGRGFHTIRGTAASAIDVADMAHRSPDRKRGLMLCARAFAPRRRSDDIWDEFPNEVCAIPETMIVRRGDGFRVHFCRTVSPDTDPDRFFNDIMVAIDKTYNTAAPATDFTLPDLHSVTHLPDFAVWKKIVSEALRAIANGRIEKIVLARRTDYRFDHRVEPFQLLTLLMESNRTGYAMMWQIDTNTAFVSVTPERLYYRDTDLVSIDALSSTVPRGETPEEDRRLEQKLRSDDKLRREHQYVVEGVARSIAPLCRKEPLPGALSVFKLDRIQHLATSVSGFLNESVGDADIIGILHPTPAVGGTPRDAVMEMIPKLEGFDRGWYASPIGIIDGNEAEFAVGIRSAMVRGSIVSVFSGAGIVRGSDPISEWDEIESKNILNSLTGERAKL